MTAGRPRATHRRIVWLLRILGAVDLLAFAAVLAPRAWLDSASLACGVGSLPSVPIVGYLARSASAMYALHGAVVLFVARDVVRYAPLIRFLGMIAVAHGIVTLGIDTFEQMPLWWRWTEGPCFAGAGALIVRWQTTVETSGDSTS